MKNSIKLLAVVAAGILIMGCEGPKIKQAIDALKPQVDELQNQVATMQAPLGQLTELGKQVDAMTPQPPEKGKKAVKAPKIEAAKIDSLITSIDGAKGSLVSLLAIGEQVKVMKDSLAVLDKKASGENKTAITELNGKLDAVASSLGEVKMACGVADGLKGKLEAMKAPVKVEKKVAKVPAKKIVK
jgi:outer membrane murein-binding lipoprotein Lpp